MPWAAGSFSRVRGATGWQDDLAGNIFILASRHDTHDQDISDGINACLTRDNQAKPTANFEPQSSNAISLGSSSKSWAQAYFGTIKAAIWNDALSILGYYGQTPAELAASVTPTNYFYPQPDLRRYGCDVSGATDNTTQIQNAIAAAVASGGPGYIWHPGGTISHASQISWPNGLAVIGWNRKRCIFNFTGNPGGSPAYTRSGWRNVNGPNGSGFANVSAHGVTFNYVNSKIGAACVECNGGFSYYDFDDCEFTGQAQYGLILDAVEICHVTRCRVANQGTASSVNIWVVNGQDRVAGQNTGFANVITISDNQIAGNSGTGIVDDGGNAHTIKTNNFDGHSTPAQFAACESLLLQGNSFETTLTTGSANVLFNNLSLGGTTVGPCVNGVVQANSFFGNIVSGSLLVFSGDFHTGMHVAGNVFGNQAGRGAAIDVTKLASSFCGYNTDQGTNSMFHYSGAHNDINGNTLLPPQNPSAVTWNIKGLTYGDQRTPMQFNAGTIKKFVAVPYPAVNGVTGITFNAAAGDSFDITVTDANAFNINVPLGDAPAYDFWLRSTAYSLGDRRIDATNQNVYVCSQAGTSSAAGTGPSGMGTGIVDNTAKWDYVSGTTSTLTAGQQITIHINNTSGGAMGAITWNAVFKMSAWTNPANGQNRAITFEYNGSSWKQVSQTGADIPN